MEIHPHQNGAQWALFWQWERIGLNTVNCGILMRLRFAQEFGGGDRDIIKKCVPFHFVPILASSTILSSS